MRILVAEDNDSVRKTIVLTLEDLGYSVIQTDRGDEALDLLQSASSPNLAILDWNMPGCSGLDVCKRLRNTEREFHKYLILLTVRNLSEEIAAGLDAGADDYMVKPFDLEELRARVAVGKRVIDLQKDLAGRVCELQEALAHVKRLQGLLPICMHCHKIRNDQQTWQRLEEYITEHSDATLSHGLCPDCARKHYPELALCEDDRPE